MSAIAVMFFIRWAYLTFLVIVSPAVIFTEVFPVVSFKKLSFENWSQQFIRWLLFAPVMIFFIYLTLSLSSIGLDVVAGAAFGSSLGLGVGRLILQLALLGIGLQQANNLSLGGGKLVFGTASNLFEKAKRLPVREGKSLGTIFGQRIMETPQYRQVKNKLAGSFITRPLAVGSDVLAGRLKESQKKSIGEYAAAYKDWSKETLIRYLNSANLSLMNPQARTALLQQLQEKKITSINEDDLLKVGLDKSLVGPMKAKIKLLVSAAQSIKATGTFEKTWPHLTAEPTKVIKKLKPSEILDVVPEAFGPDVVLSISESQFRKLGDEGSDEQKQIIENTLRVLVGNLPAFDPNRAKQLADIIKKLKRIPTWVVLADDLSNIISSQKFSTLQAPGGQPNPTQPTSQTAASPQTPQTPTPQTTQAPINPSFPQPSRTEGGSIFFDDVVFQKPEEEKQPVPQPNKIEDGTALFDDVVFQEPEEKKE
jgi:hypothetical protein